ncbi:MAG: hypothetical protein V3U11_01530 [Planctomycetota bacterium]
MMSPRSLPILILALLVVPAPAQDSKPTSTATGAAHKKLTPLQKLMAAAEAERPQALVAFIQDQIASGVVYAGQYSALEKLSWDVKKLLQAWLLKAPGEATNSNQFRVACINALRDLVKDGKASEDLLDVVKQVAKDWFENQAVQRHAAFALAQFGDRSLVDASIKKATAETQKEEFNSKLGGWDGLATIHYNLREYDNAVTSYLKLIKLAEEGGVRLRPTVFYNCGCSLALAGKTDEAFTYVEKALKLDTARELTRRSITTDMDIASLRKDERFAVLLEKYRGTKKKAKKKAGKQATDSRPTSKPGKDNGK